MTTLNDVKKAISIYQKTGLHREVLKSIQINDAQGYAINILGRDRGLTPKQIHAKINLVTDKMTVGEIAGLYGVDIA